MKFIAPKVAISASTQRNFTIFTDASYCHQSKVAGYAYWARNDVSKFQSKTSEINVHCNVAAEAKAIVWAVSQVAQEVHLAGKLVIVVSDCKPAMDKLETEPPEHDRFRPLYDDLKALSEKHDFDLKFNHVKAHSGVGQARNWVNDWCDRACRSAMRKTRSQLSKGQHGSKYQ